MDTKAAEEARIAEKQAEQDAKAAAAGQEAAAAEGGVNVAEFESQASTVHGI